MSDMKIEDSVNESSAREETDLEELGRTIVQGVRKALEGAMGGEIDQPVAQAPGQRVALKSAAEVEPSEFFDALTLVKGTEKEEIPDYEDVMGCSACGHPMTDEERFYYEYRCESCERAWHERIQAWRADPESDPEVGKLFDVPAEVQEDKGKKTLH